MPRSTRTFRIFVSSTFTDLKAERNALQERVFPRLRALCAAHGCRFQAIDLRWGISDEATLDQQTMSICLGEVERCQQTSPRPNFILLLGDRYGWQPLPARIPLEEFERILQANPDAVDRYLLESWYRPDRNSRPPQALLQARQGEKADYADPQHWAPVEARLRQLLRRALDRTALPEAARRKYIASATEQEIACGALQAADAPEHVFAYLRQVSGLPQDASAAGYIDFNLLGRPDPEARQHLEALKKNLADRLPRTTRSYKARWKGGAPTLEHLEALCRDVYQDLSQVILKEISRLQALDELDQEIAAQAAFGEERRQFFIGRTQALQCITQYLHSAGGRPLLVLGASGMGKSALLAQALHQTAAEIPGAVLLARFIGATAASTQGRSLLSSLCRQLRRSYGLPPSEIPPDDRSLAAEFQRLLQQATPQRPLVLFLDALDQLAPGDPVRDLRWLPSHLPEHVSLVLSCLPGELQTRLEALVPVQNRLELAALSPAEGSELLDRWLEHSGRALQPEQRRYLLAKFAANPNPLYLRLAFEQARHWDSDTAVEGSLGEDIPALLRAFFQSLSQEARHGPLLVAHSLALLASARYGLSEEELLDLLSVDEAVMQEFQRRSQQSLPEVTRLPVVIWSRLSFDLQPYLAERRADGQSLLVFFHRQLGEVIQAEFFQGEQGVMFHQHLARYFSQQPLYLPAAENAAKNTAPLPNLRRLSELPYQQAGGLLGSALFATLSSEEVLQAKLQAQGLPALLDDFALVRRSQADSEGASGSFNLEEPSHLGLTGADAQALGQLKTAVEQMAHWIARSPGQFAAQLHGRLAGATHPNLERLLQASRAHAPALWLRPMAPSLIQEGELAQQTLADLPGSVSALALSPDERRLAAGVQNVAGSGLAEIAILDAQYGSLINALPTGDPKICSLLFLPGSRQVVAGLAQGGVQLFDLDGGEAPRRLLSENKVARLALLEDGRHLACLGESAHIVNLLSGSVEQAFPASSGAAALTPDGSLVIVSRRNPAARGSQAQRVVLEAATGRERLSRPDRVNANLSALSADGALVLDAGLTGLECWRVSNGEQVWRVGGLDLRLSALWVTGRQAIAAAGGAASSAAISGANRLLVYDLANGALLHTLTGHSLPIDALALGRDERILFTGSADQSVKRWQIGTLAVGSTSGRRIANANAPLTALAVSAQGQHLAVGAGDGSLTLWDVARRAVLRRFTGHGAAICGAFFTAGGRKLVTAATDGGIYTWDVPGGQALSQWEDPAGKITCLGVSPDGKWAVAGSGDLCLRVWNLESGENTWDLSGHEKQINAICFSPDGRRCYSAGKEAEAFIWDATNWDPIGTFTSSAGETSALVAGPGENRLLQAGEYVMDWDLAARKSKEFLTLENVTALALAHNQRWLAAGLADGTVHLWDVSQGKWKTEQERKFGSRRAFNESTLFEVKPLQVFKKHNGAVRALAFSPDDGQLLSGGEDGDVRAWDLAAALTPSPWHTGRVNRVVVSPDSRVAVSSSEDGTLKAWDLENGARALDLPGYLDIHSPSGEIAFCLDDRSLVSAPKQKFLADYEPTGSIKIWDLASGRLKKAYQGTLKHVTSLAVLQDRRTLVFSDLSGVFHMMDASDGRFMPLSGQPVLVPAQSDLYLVSVLSQPLSSAGKSGEGRALCLWNRKLGTQLCQIALPQPLRHLALDGKAHLVAAALQDGSIMAWTIDLYLGENNKLSLHLPPQASAPTSLALDPDGKRLYLGTRRGELQCWDVAKGKLLTRLELGSAPKQLTWLGDEASLLALSDDRVFLCDLSRPAILAEIGFESLLEDAVLAPSADRLVVGDSQGHVHVLAVEGKIPRPWVKAARPRNAPLNVAERYQR